MIAEEIYDDCTIAELESLLGTLGCRDELRGKLLEELWRYVAYRNAGEWNRAVRLCECLAITGWGSCEPLEAHCGMYVNGAPETCFVTAGRQPRFAAAVWSKRKDGWLIDCDRTVFFPSRDDLLGRRECVGGYGGDDVPMDVKLLSQRNWIAKNPVVITRGISNCYESSRSVIDSMFHDLMPALDAGMRPERYGRMLNRMVFSCCFSFDDGEHCKTNYIIADESLKLRQRDFYPALLEMYSQAEIERNGLFLRNRFEIGPFRRDTGSVNVSIVFEKDFGDRCAGEQKRLIAGYMLEAARRVGKRCGSKTNVDFGALEEDLHEILERWWRG